MAEVAGLPLQIGDYLRLASDTQLRVLLWIATAGKQERDAAACAKALGGRVTVKECEDALRYWEAEGLLQTTNAKPSDTPDRENRSAADLDPVIKPVPLPPRQTPRSEMPSAPASRTGAAPAARPTPVKPQMTEVVRRQKASAEFAYLLSAASARLGKALSPGDQETLLYLYDTAGLPAEVILMVIAYAVSQEKGHMRYVEKTALDWADRDIRTIAAADEYLCRLSRAEQAWEQLSAWCELPPHPTAAQKALAAKWIGDWKLSKEMLRLAADCCREKTGKFQYAYIDRVLESWRAEGWDTPKKVQAGRRPSKPEAAAASRDGGFDVGKYEELVRTHTPKYRKKGQA